MRNWLRKTWFLGIWSLASIAVLGLSLKMYNTNAERLYSPIVAMENELNEPDFLYAAIPAPDNKIKTEVGAADARAEILRQYLAEHQSPLEEHADLLVQVADENGFDFRWMVAIAQQESNLCEKIPVDSYNCWGWGIWCKDYDEVNQKCNEMKVTRFDSYEDAIRRIAPQFKEKFLVKGAKTEAHEVMGTYTPPSDGSWAFGVNQFMEDLE